MDEISVRRARLSAEMIGAPAIALPSELVDRKSEEALGRMLRTEEALFEATRRAILAEAEAQKKMGTLLDSEIASLQEQAVNLKRQEESAHRQADRMRTLQIQGLAISGREIDSDRLVSDIQSRQRDVDARVFRAQEEKVKGEEARRTSDVRRRQDAARELQNLRAEEHGMLLKMNAFRRILPVEELPDKQVPALTYALVRKGPTGEDVRLTATENTPVRAGDVLQVQIGSSRTESEADPLAQRRSGAFVDVGKSRVPSITPGVREQ
jgi:hypothetical protein